jgi:ABC-type Mn2+/Zn2+ transport system ATPase subunit
VSPTQRRIIILAGPNGAGKTTFAREFLPDEADIATNTALIQVENGQVVRVRPGVQSAPPVAKRAPAR